MRVSCDGEFTNMCGKETILLCSTLSRLRNLVMLPDNDTLIVQEEDCDKCRCHVVSLMELRSVWVIGCVRLSRRNVEEPATKFAKHRDERARGGCVVG
jgi:hypothetical protein